MTRVPKLLLLFLLIGLCLLIGFLTTDGCKAPEPPQKAAVPEKAVLVIHGGAGAPPANELPQAERKKYKKVLEDALRQGYKALQKEKGTSLDAVVAAIEVMENSGVFNAGKGAVFTHEGRNELDASIMEGKHKMAGAVAGVTRLKNPIRAARAVMEKSPHVLMIGDGAERFALSLKVVEEVNPVYFWTEERWKELQKALKKEEMQKNQGKRLPRKAGATDRHFGTVGAVALDNNGNLAAGTSTGGLTNKRHGRVGDSPIIGAGTYADNQACAVSCTGHGETFIRHAVAHDIAARVQYKRLSVARAVAEVLDGIPEEKDGLGGVIALDRQGSWAMHYDQHTDGMFRGCITKDGKISLWIYQDKE
jgi:beta-aspartyl-peptidase (threonine type)